MRGRRKDVVLPGNSTLLGELLQNGIVCLYILTIPVMAGGYYGSQLGQVREFLCGQGSFVSILGGAVMAMHGPSGVVIP